jgi:putative hemolysin
VRATTSGRKAATSASRFSTEAASRLLFKASADAHYRLRRAECEADVRAAQTLRFLVFNLELNEGLENSYATLRDEDPFDAVCDHLLVEDSRTGEVVGTYRLQTGRKAGNNLGFYSEQEFDFTPFRPIQDQLVELGRACVRSDHRGLAVLGLLWRGIIEFAHGNGARYLIGCSSLTSQDEAVGSAAYRELARDHLAPAEFVTRPLPRFVCAQEDVPDLRLKLPKLLRAYLSLGAKICGPPAIDRDFKTIDFLTLIDLETVRDRAMVQQ